MQPSRVAKQIKENVLPSSVSQALETGEDDKVAAAMAALSIPDRDRHREAVAKRLDIRPATVDKMVTGQMSEAKSEATQGRPAVIEQIEPWPDPVDGAALADEMAATVARFAVLPPGAATAVAMWVLHAWAFKSFTLSPILAFIAPTKRSGKSNALFVTGFMCPRRFMTANPTDAAAFRLIERDQPTLILDEVDKLIRRDSNAIDTLINGYQKEAATAIRCAGDDNDVRVFSVWTPKAVALIGKPRPDTLHDRCIVVEMQPKLRQESVERRRDAKLPGELLPIRRRAMRWANDNVATLRDSEPHLPDELHDRAQDNWEPLLAIADLVGGDWPMKARQAAVSLGGSLDADTERLPIRLLDALRAEGFGQHHSYVVITGTEIEELLLVEPDSPWHEVNHGKPITATKVAHLLKPLGLSPKPRHDSGRGKSVRGYRVADFERAFERYLDSTDAMVDPPSRSVRVLEAQAQQAETADSQCQVTDTDLTLSIPEVVNETGLSYALTPSQGGAVGTGSQYPSGPGGSSEGIEVELSSGEPQGRVSRSRGGGESVDDILHADIMASGQRHDNGTFTLSTDKAVDLQVKHGRQSFKEAVEQLMLVREPDVGYVGRAGWQS